MKIENLKIKIGKTFEEYVVNIYKWKELFN